MMQQTREMAAEAKNEGSASHVAAGDVEMKVAGDAAQEKENCLSDMMGQEEKSSTQA